MVKIIAVHNQKGGVGKTTTTTNVGFELARKGYKVLLADLDPQATLTAALGVTDPEETVFSALQGAVDGKETRLFVCWQGTQLRGGFGSQHLNALRHDLIRIKVFHLIVYGAGSSAVVNAVEFQRPGIIVRHQTDRLLAAPDKEIGQLFTEVVVHYRIGDLGPAIHDVPPDNAGSLPLLAAETLHKILFGFRL